MNFDLSDVLRSIIIGQSIMAMLLSTGYTVLVVKLKQLRPGAILGVTCIGIGNVGGAVFVLIVLFERLGRVPIDYHTWLAMVVIFSTNLGCSLLSAHLILHDDRMRDRLTNWFGHK